MIQISILYGMDKAIITAMPVLPNVGEIVIFYDEDKVERMRIVKERTFCFTFSGGFDKVVLEVTEI